MKALKNESSLYMDQISSAITACYENNSKPSNQSLMELYTLIGQCICHQGEKAFVVHLSEMLDMRFPTLKGFSFRNLRRMRDFYHIYANDPTLMAKAQSLNWTQNAVILEYCGSNAQRAFYINLAAAQNLSKLALMRAIQENASDISCYIEESITENAEPSLAPVSDIPLYTGVDTTAHIETACEPFVPACEPLHQGDDMPNSINRAFARVSGVVSMENQGKRKNDETSLNIGFINQHKLYYPPLIRWNDKLKPPQNAPPGVQP